jgi:hypothetical protein
LLNGSSVNMNVKSIHIGCQSSIPFFLGPPSVSKVAKGPMRVHITGVSPIEIEIARTQSARSDGFRSDYSEKG